MDQVVTFIDGACEPKNPGGVATYGFVVYLDGKEVGRGSGLATEPWTERASNNVAEYTALIRALEELLVLGLEQSDVEVRSDSRLLVRQVNGEYAVNAARLKPLHKRVNELLPQFERLRLKWVPREENTKADALTRDAYASYLQAYPNRADSATASLRPSDVENVFVFCSQCGTKIPADSRFCKECGARLAQ